MRLRISVQNQNSTLDKSLATLCKELCMLLCGWAIFGSVREGGGRGREKREKDWYGMFVDGLHFAKNAFFFTTERMKFTCFQPQKWASDKNNVGITYTVAQKKAFANFERVCFELNNSPTLHSLPKYKV